MCGACGTGLASPPWEVIAHGGTARDLRERAREAEMLCGGRLRVRPFGPAGYQTTGRTGRVTVHGSLDGLVADLITTYGRSLAAVVADPDRDGPVAHAVRAALQGEPTGSPGP